VMALPLTKVADIQLQLTAYYSSVNLLFQTSSEDSSLLLVLVHQRIRGFAFMRYINPRLTLTLTLIYVCICALRLCLCSKWRYINTVPFPLLPVIVLDLKRVLHLSAGARRTWRLKQSTVLPITSPDITDCKKNFQDRLGSKLVTKVLVNDHPTIPKSHCYCCTTL